jgi:hypothetical protein
MSKVETPLSLFVMGTIVAEHADHVLEEIEMEVEGVLGSFRPREYDALGMANIPNGGHLNQVLKQMGVPYAARPLPVFEASHAAIKEWKAEVSKNPAAKKVKYGPNRATPSKMAPPLPKTGPAKKIGVLKITRPKAQPGP